MNVTQDNKVEEFVLSKEELDQNIIARNIQQLYQAHDSGVVKTGYV